MIFWLKRKIIRCSFSLFRRKWSAKLWQWITKFWRVQKENEQRMAQNTATRRNGMAGAALWICLRHSHLICWELSYIRSYWFQDAPGYCRFLRLWALWMWWLRRKSRNGVIGNIERQFGRQIPEWSIFFREVHLLRTVKTFVCIAWKSGLWMSWKHWFRDEWKYGNAWRCIIFCRICRTRSGRSCVTSLRIRCW